MKTFIEFLKECAPAEAAPKTTDVKTADPKVSKPNPAPVVESAKIAKAK